MKQLKWIFGIALLAVVPVLAIVNVAHAQRFASSVDADQQVHSSLYSSGRNVNIKGEIFGDVFCAGQNVVVDATVHGDVICAGQDVTVNGTVDGDIRLAGQSVNVAAAVAGSGTVAGQKFSLDATAKIGRDLTATGTELNIKGAVTRDVVVSGTRVTLNGNVGRNVSVGSDKTELKNNARIAGNLTYSSTKPKLLDGAQVAGKTEQAKQQNKRGGMRFNPVIYLFMLLGALVIMVVLTLLFPRYLERTSGRIWDSPGRALLVGFVAALLLPLAIVGTAFTIVGIPLALFLIVAAIFAALLTTPISAYLTGRLVLRRSKNPMGLALLGVAILVTLYFIPFVGFIFVMAAYWLGFGALLTDLYAHSRFGRSAPAPAKKAAK